MKDQGRWRVKGVHWSYVTGDPDLKKKKDQKQITGAGVGII